MSLLSFKEATAELGLKYPTTVRDIVDSLGITPKELPYNGRARGLDETDMQMIRKALGRPARAKASASA